mmetsp:Transcript_979/g.1157  ORF Transcript_979/g.1157 Transcript_979/m.1157 type:complete len:218 (+) Transcript_979:374-1027(+)
MAKMGKDVGARSLQSRGTQVDLKRLKDSLVLAAALNLLQLAIQILLWCCTQVERCQPLKDLVALILVQAVGRLLDGGLDLELLTVVGVLSLHGLGLVDHPLDVGSIQALARVVDRAFVHRLRLLVDRRDIQHAISIQGEADHHLSLTLLCSRDARHRELAQQVVAICARPLPFEHPDVNRFLVILCGRVSAFLRAGHGCVSRNDDGVVLALRFYTQG